MPPTTASSSSSSTAAVVTVGIDVGTQTVKAVLGPSHDYEIVRCGMGGHSTPTAVTFRDRERFIGERAAESRSADGNTVFHLNRLLPGGGAAAAADDDDDGGGDALSEFYRFETAASSGGEGTSASVRYDGSRRTFSSSALLAMLLGKVKGSVDATVDRLGGGGGAGRKCKYVLTLPPGSSPAAERAVLDAAHAAGMGGGEGEDGAVIAGSSRCYAAAYGRKWAGDAAEGEARERTVVVVDMGHSQTTVAVLRLGGDGAEASKDAETGDAAVAEAGAEAGSDEKKDKEKGEGSDADAEAADDDDDGKKAAVTVLGSSCSRTLGAGRVDARLWRHFAATLPNLSPDLTPASRGGQRLLEGCRKLKHLLSMLPSSNVTVECLGADERDVTLNGTRDVLVDLCAPEAQELKALIDEALRGAGIALDGGDTAGGGGGKGVDSIEVLGGGCRIPLFQETILAALGREGGNPEKDLSRGLDDTSVALGAAALGDDATGRKLVAGGRRGPDDADTDTAADADDEGDARRSALAEAEKIMAALDAEMSRRSEARNGIEAHVLEMRGAKHGAHGKSLPEGTQFDEYLDNLDDWLFSDECDGMDVQEMEKKLADVLEETRTTCAEYFEAVRKEAEEKEREMEEEAKKAEAERAAEGGGDDDDGDHDTRRLPKKRRMEIVMKNKNEANELLRDGNHRHAAARYHKALTHCGKFYDLGPDDEEEVKAVKLSLHLNLALAYIKLDKPDNALRSCNDALDLDPDNVKALYRRASVYYDKKKWDDAGKDAKRAAETAPDDKAVKKLQARIEQQVKRQKVKEKKMAQKMFG